MPPEKTPEPAAIPAPDTGGPVHPIVPDKHRAGSSGITLRAHIATAVYPGIIEFANRASKGKEVNDQTFFPTAASMALEAADALIAALKGGGA